MPTPLFLAPPAGPPRGGVVVIQEAFGITGYIEDVCHRLAAAGWYAVAPHLFHRTGDPPLAYDDYQAMRPHTGALTVEGITEDVDAALQHLADKGVLPTRAGLVGFCMGGSIVLAMAATHKLGAGVTFYGGGLGEGRFGLPPLVELGSGLKTPWLGLFGDDDPSIPVEQVEQLRAEVTKAPVVCEVVRYPGAGHGFHCDARPEAFNAEAAADAWARTLAWFHRHIGAT